MSTPVRLFLLVAGAGDTLTGILLVALPAKTLALMGVSAPPPTDTVFLRFIGVFVAAVGWLYIHPFLTGSAGTRDRRLRFTVEATTIVRTAVALFVGACLVEGLLPLPWISVALTDGLIAGIQIAILRRSRSRVG